MRENVQMSEVLASFSQLFPSPEFEKQWDLKNSSDLAFIGMTHFDVGRNTGLLMRLWDKFKTLHLPPLFGEVTLFSLNSNILSKLACDDTHSPFLVWLFDAQIKGMLRAGMFFQIDCSISTCWFQRSSQISIPLYFAVNSIQSDKHNASNRLLYWD